MECAGKQVEIPNFDMSVKTRSGQRTGRRLLVHLARDISEQKKTEQLVHKVLDLSQQLSQLGESSRRTAPVSDLSEQEKHILCRFAEGKSTANVAKSLDISPQTLRNHLHHINQKLRTHNRLEAVMHAIHRKLI